MKKLLKKILSVLDDFMAWLWGKFSPPERKPWCAIFYFVAQEDPGITYPDTDLDAKLLSTIANLKAMTFDGQHVHVVYRAVWANPAIPPTARVVGPLFPAHSDFFPGCSPSLSTPVTIGADITCFFKWAYKWCPADEYAVFFWGHSFGPAGLFEPGGPITVPRPTGLASLRDAFEEFMRERAKDGPAPPIRIGDRTTGDVAGTPPGGPPSPTPAPGSTEAFEEWAKSHPKIEAVFFQDCWMSTLETAFELQAVASYVVASQSLVPIGKDYSDFIWPYADLIADLTTANAKARVAKMCNRIAKFYSDQFDLNHIPDLISLPWAALDLSAVPQVKAALKLLVNRLMAIAPVPSNKGLLIEPGIIAAFAGAEPAAGDPVLVDIRRMCNHMNSASDALLKQRALDLADTLDALITLYVEVQRPAVAPAGFRGISALYRPPSDRLLLPSFIAAALKDGSYQALKLPSQTGWPGTENPAA